MPLELLRVLGRQEAVLPGGIRHLELYTPSGMLTLLWHGPSDAERVLLTCGGAMGGLLGPARGLYHDLAMALAEQGIATVRVGYRRPNDLEHCALDVLAAMELAAHAGGRRFVSLGHSFGGAVAVQVGAAEPMLVAGVVAMSTQAAGCEVADQLAPRPFLLLHGDHDTVLPMAASELVRMLADHGDLVVLHGADHSLSGAADEVRARLLDWIPAVLAGEDPGLGEG